MTREEAIKLLCVEKSTIIEVDGNKGAEKMLQAYDMAIEALKEKNRSDSLVRDDAENCKESESKLDLISRQDAIRWVKTECNPYGKPTIDFESGKRVMEHLEQMPSTEPKTDEENELKFYYVESIDDYWIGRRLDNFYYADWHEGLGFVWSKSRYLQWGEHIVDENTLWKEHTYPSEPIEIPFTEWIKGFVKKYFAEPKTGEWIQKDMYADRFCSKCNYAVWDSEAEEYNFCPNCGARMGGGAE